MSSRFGHFKDADSARQEMVRRAPEVAHGNRGVDGERGALAFGMYAGVGAAGSSNEDLGAFDLAQDGLELRLDGGDSRLYLPAVEVRAIIRDSRADAARWAFHLTVGAGEARCRPGKPYYTIENSGNNCPQFVRLDSQ